MSGVDKRVVDMQFNNKQFEANVQTSIKSLDNLKKGLNLDASAKSLNNLNAAGRAFSLDGIASGVDAIRRKFDVLGIVGIATIQNITNTAVNAGKTMLAALTVDPLRKGLEEYETQINAVQTILANTASKGTTLTQVNAALDELNTYADKTIYNFTEMTRNIGTFTAAGVDLKTSTQAIKGIANLAAVSGSNAMQASTAMYQLSQALSAGTVKLMDWNSVVNAGMGGQVFQDSLKETARKHKVNIDQMIKDQGSFRLTLESGWLTSNILTETLAKFTGELSESQLKSMGYTKKQIDEIIKLGQMANDAATKVKTLTQLFDTLREALQSGWAQSWRIIVGDFGEAKELFTEISDIFGGMINQSSKARNAVLSSGLSSGWNQLLNQGIPDEEGYKESINKITKAHGKSLDQMIEAQKLLAIADGKTIDDRQAFTNVLKSGVITSDDLGKALSDLAGKTRGLSADKLKDLGYTKDQIAALEALDKGVKEGTISLSEFRDKMLISSGRENIIQALRNAFEGLMSVVKPVKEAFSEIFPPATGEQLYALTERIKEFTANFKIGDETAAKLKSTFKGVFAVVDIGIQVIKGFVSGVINLISYFSPLGTGLLDVTSSIGNFLTYLDDVVKKTNFFGLAFNGVANAMKFVADVVRNSATAIGQAFSGLGNVDLHLFDGLVFVAGMIGKAFTSLKNAIGKSLDDLGFDSMLDVLNGGLIAALLLGLKKLMVTFSNLAKNGPGWIGGIRALLDGVKGSLTAFQNDLKANTLLKIAGAIGILALSLLVLSTIDPVKLTSSLAAITIMFVELFGSMAIFEKIAGDKGFKSMGRVSLAMIGLSTAVLLLSFAMKNLSELDWNQIAKGLTAIGILMAELVAVSMVLEKNSAKMVKGSVGLILFATSIVILTNAVKELGKLDFEVLKKGLIGVGVVLAELVLFMKLTNTDKMGVTKGLGIIALAAAINIMAIAVSTLGNMDTEKLKQGLLAIGMVLAELVLFIQLTGNPANVISTAIGMTILSSAMIILAKAVSAFGDMDWEKLKLGLKGMGGALLIIVAAMWALPPNMIGSAAALLIVSTALVVLSNAMQNLGGMDWEQMKLGLIGLAGSLTIIAVAMAFMTTALPGAAALLIVSAALMLLTPVLIALGAMSLTSIGTGLLALAGAFAVIGVSALILAPLTPVILALAAAIAIIGVGCLAAGAGLLALSAGLAAIAVSGVAGGAAIIAIVKALLDLIPVLLAKIGEGIVAFAKVITDGAPAIANAIGAVLLAFMQVIVTSIPAIVNTILVLLGALLDAIVKFVPKLVDAGMKILIGFLKGISDNIQQVVETAISIVVNILKGIANKLPDVIQAGVDLIISFIDGLAAAVTNNKDRAITSMNNLIGALLDAAVSVLTNPITGILSIGKQIITGLIQGLGMNVADVTKSAQDVGSNILNAIKSFFRIKSPSRLMRDEVGNYIVQGIAEGITKDMSAEEAATKKAQNIMSAFKDALDKIDLSSSTTAVENELWNAQNRDTASESEKFDKNISKISKDIEGQKKKVEIADAKYNTMRTKFGGDNNDTKQAYKDFVSEQSALAQLSNKLTDTRKEESERIAKVKEDFIRNMEETSDLEYQLWNAQNGSTASDLEKSSRELALLTKKLNAQQEKQNIAANDYNTKLNTLGKCNSEVTNAYKTFLQEQVATSALLGQYQEANKANADKLNTARINYYNYLTKNNKMLLDMGISQAEIDEAARKDSGYNPDSTIAQTMKTNVEGAVTDAMTTVTTVYEQKADQTFVGLVSSFGEYGKSYAESLGTGFLNAFDVVMDSIKTALDSLESELQNRLNNLSSEMNRVSVANGGSNISPIIDLTSASARAKTISASTSTNKAQSIAKTKSTTDKTSQNGSTSTAAEKSIVFQQYNNSPKALDRIDIYRQTQRLLAGRTT